MPTHKKLIALIVALVCTAAVAHAAVWAARQDQQSGLTPIQLEIEKQRQRLSSADVEERRDALVQLRGLHHPQASRVAQGSLSDQSPIVRATAAGSVIWLPADEGATSLLPLLTDKDEFVRQQTAYALGQTRSRVGVASLVERLTDKKDSVRGAAAVALGEIADRAAVAPLAALLMPSSTAAPTKKSKKKKLERNPFVLRAAAHSLGQIADRAALPALFVALQDDMAEDDVRREAAWALGSIGDAAALPILQAASTARDPYLADIANRAVKKILKVQANGSR
jgi:HEAT repeat protein